MTKIRTLLVMLPAAMLLHAQEGGLDLGGSVMDQNLLLHGVAEGSLAYAGSIQAELSALNRDRQDAKIEADVIFTLLYGQYADAFLAPAQAAGLASIPTLGTALGFDVRKLSLTLYLGPADLTLGRKIVNWGYGRIFSPADAYSSVDITDISFRRRGSDVIMADVYLDTLTGLSLIVSPTTDMSGFRSGLKAFTSLLGFDASLIGVYRNTDQDLTVGAALKGSVPPLGIGLTLEGVRHVVGWGDDGWFEAMTGLDYSFFDRTLILMAEYYYNGRPIDAGSLSPADLGSLGRVFLRRQYVFASAVVTPVETLGISASALLDIDDLTMIGALELSWSVFDNTTISATVRYLAGDINDLPVSEYHRLEYGVSAQTKF
jgi:hypothetical protein